jgi:hypothetical protein
MSFFSLSFLFPLALAAFPLAAIINYLPYRAKKESTRKPVPTFFLLSQFKIETQPISRAFPPLRYFFELFIISVLIITLAQPFFSINQKKVAVLIDNSFSTWAKTSKGSSYSDIIEGIDTLNTPPLDVYDMFLSSSPSAPTQDYHQQPTYTEDKIDYAIDKILSNDTYERVIVFTDKTYLKTSPSWISVRTFNDYITKNNISLGSCSWISESKKITSEIHSSSSKISSLYISVTEVKSGKIILKQKVDLPPFSKETFELGPLETKSSLLKVTIFPEPASNAIVEDDQQHVNRDQKTSSILVKSPRTLQDLGLEGIKSFKFTHFSDKNSKRNLIGTIYHQTLPPKKIQSPTLVIAPPEKFHGGIMVKPGSLITFIESGHLISKYLEYRSITLPYHTTFTPPQHSNEILRTNGGTAIWTKTIQSGSKPSRLAVSGLELLPFQGSKVPFSSILFLNMLNWTFSSENTTDQIRPYSLISKDFSESVLFYPLNTTASFPEKKTTPFSPTVPGTIISTNGKTKGEVRRVSFIDEKESNLHNNQPLVLNKNRPNTVKNNSIQDYTYWLVLLLAAIWIFDTLLFYTFRGKLGKKLKT